MSNRPLSLDNFTESIAGLSSYQKLYSENDKEYQKMLKVLVKAIDGELTERQKECVIRYYGQKMKIADIAKELNIYPSTVSRHLSKSRHRLQTVIGYYFPRLSSKQ